MGSDFATSRSVSITDTLATSDRVGTVSGVNVSLPYGCFGPFGSLALAKVDLTERDFPTNSVFFTDKGLHHGILPAKTSELTSFQSEKSALQAP